jgi:hypothetical protein
MTSQKQAKIDFSGITDWNQTNEAIAKQLRCCEKSVRTARRARGLPRAPDKAKCSILKERLSRIRDEAWKEYGNHHIARILDCSVTAVRMFRVTNGKPALTRR